MIYNGIAVDFYNRTRCGQKALEKVAGGKFFSFLVRSPVPKRNAFGWTSTEDFQRKASLTSTAPKKDIHTDVFFYPLRKQWYIISRRLYLITQSVHIITEGVYFFAMMIYKAYALMICNFCKIADIQRRSR